MGPAASTSSEKRPAGNLKAKASYLILVLPLLGFIALIWKASHKIAKPNISIYRAAERGDQKAVEAHVLTGTPVNSLSSDGHSPLYYAALSGKPEIVEFLIKNGASPNAEASGKTSALYVAAGLGNLRMVKDLIAAGADPKNDRRASTPPLDAAANGGNPAIIKLFLEMGADPNAPRKPGTATPLCNACIKGNLESVNLLLEHGANVNAPGFDGRKPILYATQSGHYDIVARLLEKGASADSTDAHFVLVLSSALSGHVDERISWLLFNHMKDFNALDYHSRNLLHYAAEGGASLDLMKALIAKGIDPNAIDFLGDSPVSIAISRGDADLQKALIEAGARVTLRQLIRQALQPPKNVAARRSPMAATS